MKSAIILLIIYASVAVAQVTLGIQYLGHHSYHGVSYQQFGISVANGATGYGLTNSIANVQFYTVPDLLNPFLIYNLASSAQQYYGNIGTICAQASGWATFSVISSVVDSSPEHSITLTVVYDSESSPAIISGVFALSTADHVKKDVEVESVDSVEARGTNPTFTPPGDWAATLDTQTWESLGVKAGTANLYSVSATITDPSGLVAIGYTPGTTSLNFASITVGHQGTGSVSMEADDGTYPLNITVTYYLAASTSLGSQQSYSQIKNLDVSGKRLAGARKVIAASVQTSSLRTEYAIGIASAGVAVAAVAVVAAVVIIRRKKTTVSDL